jgi:hypothetical protein
MRPITRRLSAALLATASAAALAACGGGDSKTEGDVESLLDRAFRQSVTSADVKVDAQLELDGVRGLDRPIRLEASGVYIAGKEKLPQADIDLRLGSQEAGQTVESGFLSTGDRAFLKFGGEFYEQPREDIDRANRELRGAEGDGGAGALRDLGLDPRRWIVDAASEGEDDVAGARTEHVSAKLDSRAVFLDLNKLVERSAGAVGGITPGTPRPLSAADLDRLTEVVGDPSFDVYVGAEDDIIRRISASVEITVPEADRARFGGLESGTLRFSVELSDVNGDQKVEAPANSRPIEDLTTQLGGLGALGAPEPESERLPAPEDGATTVPEAGVPGEARGTDALQQYTDCLDQASPGDTDAIARCRELLPGSP